jgi:hypothetical protein
MCWADTNVRTLAGRPLLLADGMQPIPMDVGADTPYRAALSAPLQASIAPFVNLKVRVSCEALMPGKRPGIRFLVRVIHPGSYRADTRVAGILSEVIIVTTNRAKGRGEGAALLQIKGVQKLPGVGTETARKLAQFDDWKHLLHPSGLGEAANRVTNAVTGTHAITTVCCEPAPLHVAHAHCGAWHAQPTGSIHYAFSLHATLHVQNTTSRCEIVLLHPEQGNCVQVGDLGRLLAVIESDTALVRQLRDILRFPDDARWQNLLDAVKASVVVDNRVRAFQCPAAEGELLLLYACHEGQIDFARPLGLLHAQSSTSTALECALCLLPEFAI